MVEKEASSYDFGRVPMKAHKRESDPPRSSFVKANRTPLKKPPTIKERILNYSSNPVHHKAHGKFTEGTKVPKGTSI